VISDLDMIDWRKRSRVGINGCGDFSAYIPLLGMTVPSRNRDFMSINFYQCRKSNSQIMLEAQLRQKV
jgi:hypothetical protein